MFTRALLLVHEVIVAFALQALHNVVKNAKFHVVEASPMSILLGDIVISIDQHSCEGVPASFSSS